MDYIGVVELLADRACVVVGVLVMFNCVVLFVVPYLLASWVWSIVERRVS